MLRELLRKTKKARSLYTQNSNPTGGSTPRFYLRDPHTNIEPPNTNIHRSGKDPILPNPETLSLKPLGPDVLTLLSVEQSLGMLALCVHLQLTVLFAAHFLCTII